MMATGADDGDDADDGNDDDDDGVGDGGDDSDGSDDGDNSDAGIEGDAGAPSPPSKQLGPQPLPPLGRGGHMFQISSDELK